MVNVNGMEMPMKNRSGLLVLEEPSGHQTWALIVNATVEYGGGDVEFSTYTPPELKLEVTLPPGEKLRYASTFEVGEENVLVYSRLLVEVLREERERYAELERRFGEQGVQLRKAREEAGALAADRDEMLWSAWRHGASQGWFYGHPMEGKTLDEVLEMNPHPAPEPDETDGCHICGGPDH